MVRGFRYRIYPTDEQITLLAMIIGSCRWMWNHMLGDHIAKYKETKENYNPKPSSYKEDNPWLYGMDSSALSNVEINFHQAFTDFFAGIRGFPKFKAKHHSAKKYTTSCTNNNIRLTFPEKQDTKVANKRFAIIRLPKVGEIKVRYHRDLPAGYRIKSCTVTQEPNGDWYISIRAEFPKASLKTKKKYKLSKRNTIGLDYKSDGLYKDSNGYCPEMPKYFRQSQEKLAREQRRLSRMREANIDHYEEGPKGGRIPVWKRDLSECKNYQKQRQKVADLQAHVANQRRDFLDKESTRIADTFDVVGVEGMSMKNIARSLNLGKATCDNGYGMFREMLEYKLAERHKKLVRADQFFPSSQACSKCHAKNKAVKDVKVKEWTCPECGAYHDRDENAAINLRDYAMHEVFGTDFVEPFDVVNPQN
jgi:putative transposase